MRPTIPDGAPRFIESSHGLGSGWLGPALNPFTADANPVLNIDAGPIGPRFFLATGGDIQDKSTRLRERITAEAGLTSPPADLPRLD